MNRLLALILPARAFVVSDLPDERRPYSRTRRCEIGDCDRPHDARGMCNMHYRRWKRWGDPHHVTPPDRIGPGQAFTLSVLEGTAPREPNGCILWPFARDAAGYVRAGDNQGRVNVYRFILEHCVGPRPSERHTAGHALHEVCGNRHCIAPEHLSWQTPLEQNAQQRIDGTVRGGNPAKATNDEKAAIARRFYSGEKRLDLAAEFDVHGVTISSWIRWAEAEGLVDPASNPRPVQRRTRTPPTRKRQDDDQ